MSPREERLEQALEALLADIRPIDADGYPEPEAVPVPCEHTIAKIRRAREVL